MFEGLFQPMHLLVIAGIALLVFGPKKLPELGKGIGEGIRGFKAAINNEEKPTNTTTTAIAQDITDEDQALVSNQQRIGPVGSPRL